MPGLERTLELAKRGSLVRSELYAKMQALAEERREPGQSSAQAFAKFVSGEGAELMQVHSALGCAGSGNLVCDAPAPSSMPVAKSAGSGDWHDLVAFHKQVHKRSHPHDSDSKANAVAVNAAMSTPEGVLLFKRQKREEQIGSGQFTKLDMEMLGGAEAEQQHHVDLHKRANQYKSEFEHMVADTLRAKPHLTETQAGDFVRSKPDGMKAWLAHKGSPGRNGPPAPEGDTATTGRSGPQWQSDHSGSTPTTPARTPIRPSEEPAIKIWKGMVRKLPGARRTRRSTFSSCCPRAVAPLKG